MKIRLAEPKDAKAIAQIYAPFIHTTITFENTAPTVQEFKQRIETISKDYPWIVLEEDNTVIGYGYLSTFNVRTAYQHTADLSIYLSNQTQKKGMGTLICECLFEIARQQNIYRIVSLVTAENLISAAFHQKLNFECQGRLRNVGYKHDKWLDVSFYVKDIQETTTPETMIPFSKMDKEKIQNILDHFNQQLIQK